MTQTKTEHHVEYGIAEQNPKTGLWHKGVGCSCNTWHDTVSASSRELTTMAASKAWRLHLGSVGE